MTTTTINRGLEVHGELHSADASGIARVPLTRMDTAAPGNAVTLTLLKVLHLTMAKIVTATGGVATVFFDVDDLADGEDITGLVDGGAGADQIQVAGDRAFEFQAGRVLTVANATDNDGAYTSAGATYDEATDTTTISIPTASLTQVLTVDGDVTSTPQAFAGSLIAKGDYAANGGELPLWTDGRLRRGLPGQGVYVQAIAGNVTVTLDGAVTSIIARDFGVERGAKLH
jgi:hypothetical protein